MAKKRTIVRYRGRAKRRGHRAKFSLPVAVIGGLVPAGVDILSAYKVGGVSAALGHVSMCTTGYDPSDGRIKLGFAMQKLYGPLLVGFAVHKVASRLGVNRALGRAGVPFVRI